VIAIGVPVLLAALGAWLYIYGENAFQPSGGMGGKENYFGELSNYSKYFAYALWGLAGVMFLVVIFLWSRIGTAITVIEVGSRAIFGNLGVLFSPLLALLLVVGFTALGLAAALLCFSVHQLVVEPREPSPWLPWEKGPVAKIHFDQSERKIQYLLIFIGVFMVYIYVHVYFENYYAQSSAIVDWYFGEHEGLDEKAKCRCGCFYGWWTAWTKGMGSLTIGALIMTPVYLLIAFCEYLDYKQKQNPETISMVVRFLLKCAKCCLWCFEKFLKWVNKCAFTVSQIYNQSWCRSVQIVSQILMGEVILTAIVNGIITFMMFLSKLAVALLTALAFMIYVRWGGEETEAHWLLPTVITFFLCFVVASVIMGMFENVLDITFVCVQSDKDITKDGAMPYYEGFEEDMDKLRETADDEMGMAGPGGDGSKRRVGEGARRGARTESDDEFHVSDRRA
jgi:hypothetical protein